MSTPETSLPFHGLPAKSTVALDLLAGVGCIKRIYTDLATLECSPRGLRLIDTVDGLSHGELQRLIGLPIAATGA